MTSDQKQETDINNLRQSRLSERCLEAIVNAADFVFQSSSGSQDYAGTDYTVQVPVVKDASGGSVLEVQLKSVGEGTGRLRRTGSDWSYDLDAATHDRLVKTDRALPMVLVLVVFPRAEQWLEVADSRVILMCTPYLINLEGNKESRNLSTKAVVFGSADILNPDLLRRFVATRRRGYSL